MNELECRNEDCNEVVTVEEDVCAVTCSLCCATIGIKTNE